MVESDTRIDPVDTAGSPSPSEGRSIGLHALAAAVMYVSPLLLFVPAALISAGLRHGRKGTLGAVFGSAAILLLVATIFGAPGVSNQDFAGILRMVLTVGLPAAIATVQFLPTRQGPVPQEKPQAWNLQPAMSLL